MASDLLSYSISTVCLKYRLILWGNGSLKEVFPWWFRWSILLPPLRFLMTIVCIACTWLILLSITKTRHSSHFQMEEVFCLCYGQMEDKLTQLPIRLPYFYLIVKMGKLHIPICHKCFAPFGFVQFFVWCIFEYLKRGGGMYSILSHPRHLWTSL